MPHIKKFSDEKAVRLYEKYESVWKVADELGVCGQSVHERLVKIGGIIKSNMWTKQDVEMLKSLYQKYANDHRLQELADKFGRHKSNVCRKARSLGLTDINRGVPKRKLADMSSVMEEWHSNNDHPKGMLGKSHTKETRRNMSEYHLKRCANMSEERQARITLKQLRTRAKTGSLYRNSRKTTWRQGWREIGCRRNYYRSRWEANYARYLQYLKEDDRIKEWMHEPKTFWFKKVKSGARGYLPDFRIKKNDESIEFHEVKGWMDKRSQAKLNRMKKYYPKVKIIVIGKKQYSEIKRNLSGVIKGWEFTA